MECFNQKFRILPMIVVVVAYIFVIKKEMEKFPQKNDRTNNEIHLLYRDGCGGTMDPFDYVIQKRKSSPMIVEVVVVVATITF